MAPLFARGAKAVGKELVRTTGGVASDLLANRGTWKQSLKSRLSEANSNLGRKLDHQIGTMIGDGYKARRRKKKNQSSSRSVKGRSTKKGKVNKKTCKARRQKNSKSSVELPRDIFS